MIFNQVLIIQHLSVDGGYQAIRKSEHMTRQILMFSFSILPNYRWDFCQPEKCTDIIAGELHPEKEEGGCQGSVASVPHPTLQEASRGPVWAQGEGEALGLGPGSPRPLRVHLGVRRDGARSCQGVEVMGGGQPSWGPSHTPPVGCLRSTASSGTHKCTSPQAWTGSQCSEIN